MTKFAQKIEETVAALQAADAALKAAVELGQTYESDQVRLQEFKAATIILQELSTLMFHTNHHRDAKTGRLENWGILGHEAVEKKVPFTTMMEALGTIILSHDGGC